MTDSARYFTATRCADEAESKPSSDMLLQLLDTWQIKPHQAVMVGDTVYDMQMAQNINKPIIGVSYGVHDKKAIQRHEPLYIIDALQDLHNIFLRHK
jgi:phosphoglycolate phosphatase